MGLVRAFAIFAFAILCHFSVFAEEINWDVEARVNIRNLIADCRVILSPKDTGLERPSDALGVIISDSHDPEEFRDRLKQIIEEKGVEALEGSAIYLTGANMVKAKSRELRENFQAILEEQGLSSATVKTLSVPDVKSQGFRAKVRQALQSFRYFFISHERDYETPNYREWLASTRGDMLIEAPNLAFLAYKAFNNDIPAVDAGAIISTHIATLQIYGTLSRTFTNWLLRKYRDNPDSVSRRLRERMHSYFVRNNMPSFAERFQPPPPGSQIRPGVLFLKQVMMSVPFIVNYTVLGQFTKISDFVARHTLGQNVEAFMGALPEFFATHAVTTILQTLFYKNVIVEGIDDWASRQVGETRSTAARTARLYARWPFLALDALALALSTQLGGDPLMSLGPLNITMGHVALAGLIWVGGRITRARTNSDGTREEPKVLERFLNWYLRRINRAEGDAV